MADTYRFDRFQLSPADRRLVRDGLTVEVSGRYLDALVLLVSAQGTLVTKDRFMAEVWRGVPVTDEALTQCIRALRRALGDDAGHPTFIETVPRHGYRFVAEVTADPSPPGVSSPASRTPNDTWETVSQLGRAGLVGGGTAGLIGGLAYGLAGVTDPMQPGGGAASAVFVLAGVTMVIGLLGGAAVGFGIGAALSRGRGGPWIVLGGAAGGLVVGGLVKLVGLDAFRLLLGQSPGDVTGAPEGAVLGAGVGLGVWLVRRWGSSVRRAAVVGGLTTALAGVLIAATGGRLMGGSLDQLGRAFPGSGLRLERLGGLFGEAGFGPVTQIATSAAEGGVFGACVVVAIVLSRGWAARERPLPAPTPRTGHMFG